MNIRDAFVIAGEKPVQHLRQILPGIAVQSAHNAEIDHMNHAIIVDKDVSRMQIRVKETIAEDLQEKRLGEVCDDDFVIQPVIRRRVPLVHWGRIDPRRRHDAPPGAKPVDIGHRKGRLVCEIVAQFVRRGGFEP